MPHQPSNYTDIHSLISRNQNLVSWKSPMRPYRKRSRYLVRFFLALALILSALVLFFGDPILMVPIWAVLFLFYVLSITPPPIVEHKITKFGIETAGIQIRWDALSYFYFTDRMGYEILTIVTHPPHNMHVYMIIPNETIKEKSAYLLGEQLTFMEHPPVTMTDMLIKAFHVLGPEEATEEEEEEQSKQTPRSSQSQPHATQRPTEAAGQRPMGASPAPQTSVSS